MISTQAKIKQLTERWELSRDDLKQIARKVYDDRMSYATRKPKAESPSVFAINLIYYNQWVIGPYLRELRSKRPWYRRFFLS